MSYYNSRGNLAQNAAGHHDIYHSYHTGITKALHIDASLNKNLFLYNNNVLHYYIGMPRIVSHHRTTQYSKKK
jgi:hypothetical protein